jgi:hypothetical protein
MYVLFEVEVRDDHDGGSVWYTERDDFDNEPEAEEFAAKASRERDNHAARVVKVTYEPVTEFHNGERLAVGGFRDGG